MGTCASAMRHDPMQGAELHDMAIQKFCEIVGFLI